jgi:hypothetical protein
MAVNCFCKKRLHFNIQSDFYMKTRFFSIFLLVGLLCGSLLNQASAQDLSTNGWRLWLDTSASWVNDTIYLPSDVVLSSLPVNPPTGGWSALSGIAGIPVTLPSTVEQYYSATYGNGYDGVSWWWRNFTAPVLSSGQRLVIQFRSARLRAEVYCNGKLCAYNIISEIPFEADVTSAIQPGATTNVLAVRITNPGGTFSWGDEDTINWGTNTLPVSHGFGGLDADIALVVRDAACVHDLAVLNTPNPQEVWLVSTLTNSGASAYNGPVNLNIMSNSVPMWLGTNTVSVPAGGQAVYTNDVVVSNATLWNLTNPVLYTASAAIPGSSASGAGATLGFRWFTPVGIGTNAILELNGNRIVLKTAISWGYWPVNGLYPTDIMASNEVVAAKTLGLNCLNFHRNLGHPNVLDQQDQQGLLRYQEPGGGGFIFPTNNSGAVVKPPDLTGTGGAPVTFFQRYEVAKILAMVRRDRSHPSLVIYCISNENVYALTNPISFWLFNQIRQIDPSRLVYLHSGGGAADQLVTLPYTSGTNFLVENGSGYSGYNDQHNEGGPGNYQDNLYLSATNFGLYTTITPEVVVWGEMYGVGMPDDHQAIVTWYQTNGLTSTGYDLPLHQQALASYNTFLNQWNFRSSFPSASSLFYEIGKKSYFFWQKLIENGRICDANDSLVISGWESTALDNNSGIVDVFRHFRTDPSILREAMNPEVLVMRPKRLVLKPGETANVNVHLINETGRTGPQTLTITAHNPDGSTLFTTQKAVMVTGGNVFGQGLATNLTFVVTTNGTVLIEGTIQPNGGTGSVLTNEVQLLVIDPTVGGSLPSQIAVCEGGNQITSTLSNVFRVNSLSSSNLNVPLNAIVMAPSANYNWPHSATSTGAIISNTANPGLFQNQMYSGSTGNVGYWYGFAPGNITVQLDFAEIFFNATGSRVFDVALNGTTVLTNFDIFKQAGGENVALTETFTVNATNGSILLSFPKIEANNAQIAAIKMTDSSGKVIAACFNSSSFTDNAGQVWQPYVNSLVPFISFTGAQWQSALNQVYSNGVRLVLWANGVSEASLFANLLAASNIVSIANINGNNGFLGQANASWLGAWYFSRQHWLLANLPVNSVLGWQYQVPHMDAGSVSDVGALLLNLSPKYPMDVMIGYGRDHEPIVGIGGCVIQYGSGVIVLPSLPGLRDALVTTNAEITQPVAQTLLGNALRAIPASVPSPPTGLLAVPGNAQVTLNWNPAFGGTTYNVQRSTTSGGPYTTIATNLTALSYLDVGLGNNITYYYVVSAVNAVGVGSNSSEVSAPPQVWPGLDIGSVGAAGRTSQSGDIITVNGSGADIYNAADAFQFAPQLVSGDCDIRALVTSVGNTDPWAKAGVMIRETLDPGAKNIAMVMSSGNGAEIQYRSNSGGGTSEASSGGKTAPYWVRLTRTGNTFTGYMSSDGINWTVLGSPQTMTMNSNTYVGLAVTSHNNGVLCTATFTKVSLVSLPVPWQTADIGNTGVTGSAIYPNGIFTLFGSGSDISGAADAFRYVYLTGSGDCDVKAQVLTVGNTDPWAKAGVMIRPTLNTNDANVAIVMTPGNGVSFQYRTNAAGNTAATNVGGITSPYWVRVIRTGNTFAGYMSPDGTNWTQVGTTQTMGMITNGYYIGLPVTSHNASYLCTATFANVTVGTNLNNGSQGTSSPVNLTLTMSSAGNVGIQWPYNGNLNGVSLYYTSSLTPPITWTLVTNSLLLSSNQWSVTLSGGINASGGFYRLSPTR